MSTPTGNPPQPAFEPGFVLEDYRRRCMVEHLAGPTMSLIVHAILALAAIVLITGQKSETEQVFDISLLAKLEVPVLEPPVLDPPELDDPTAHDVDLPAVQAGAPEAAVNPGEISELTELQTSVDGFNVDDFLDTPIKPTVSVLTLPVGPDIGPRGGEEKEAIEREYEIPASYDTIILRGLYWLRDHQEPGGSWSPSRHTDAMTGLALLAFLGHGETPSSAEFGDTVSKGMSWLAGRVLAGNHDQDRGYGHAIAVYALAEAAAMTGIPYAAAARDAGLTRIVAGQQPGGGFDYNYTKGTRWDLSVSAWQIQAMKAGYLGGSNVPGLKQALDHALRFVRETSYASGRFGYSKPGNGSWAIQGAGTLSMQILGAHRSPEVKTVLARMVAEYQPTWSTEKSFKPHSHPSYEWYYCGQAMFHYGKGTYKRWFEKFTPMVIEQQHRDGHWRCPGATSEIGTFDPYYSTAMNLLTLEIPFRYLAAYKEDVLLAERETATIFDM